MPLTTVLLIIAIVPTGDTATVVVYVVVRHTGVDQRDRLSSSMPTWTLRWRRTTVVRMKRCSFVTEQVSTVTCRVARDHDVGPR